MKTGVTGFFDLVGNNGMTLRVHYEETYDPTTAKRTVTITKLQVAAASYPDVYYPDGTITIDGITAVTMDSVKGTHNVRTGPVNEFKDVVGELGSVSNIGSNNDGSKSITISASVRGWTLNGSGGGNGWSVQGSKTVALTNIHRGLFYIGDEAYMPYIGNGTSWDAFGACEGNGASFDMFSA